MSKQDKWTIKASSQEQDIRLTRMYFNNAMEIVGRILILLGQGIMLGVIIIVSASLAMIATSKLPIPAVFNNFGVADGVFRGMTIMLALLGIIFSLVFVIPTLIVRNIKTIKLTGIIFITLGSFFTLLMLAISVVAYLYIPVRLNFPGVIMAGICALVLFWGSFLLWLSAWQQQKRINIAMAESLDFRSQLKVVE
ncbi:MAG: hypothetical protein EIB84_05210 [Spiroplasma poulsonii]|uniref:Transmembrane protein n=1 Tax=Spiroplasma poulsonii TaxID=2138 RepID=A0A2P6FBM8_9MOLU|nr:MULTISPECIES: hypothetical protein [Spiroplasma]KAF0851241.1 putative transmembrane protein [Spiroplasma poulsonii]MBH8623385.1 hypothetical protein [Spiroplasma sp. hyd1]MBW1242196.1 hypothetical protein [Spiroplasma poulsonii]MBW3058241.1 hypothetical protein [Spiroplasma poulsonii]PQM30836.1 hypothetical protein SMSRO_SF006270 [Spiroplasma poulsonii]